MRPPQGFLNTLQIMDALLDLRWGDYVGKWVVERKAVTPPHELVWLIRRREREAQDIRAGLATPQDILDFAGLNEEILSLQRGKRVIVFADQLTPELYNKLCYSDIKRYGGYSRYADAMQARKDAKKAARVKDRREFLRDLNIEAFGTEHSRGIYDFLTDKRRTGLMEDVKRGSRTLHDVLGVKPGEKLVGRGGDRRIQVVGG